jgi:hypothetical protein
VTENARVNRRVGAVLAGCAVAAFGLWFLISRHPSGSEIASSPVDGPAVARAPPAPVVAVAPDDARALAAALRAPLAAIDDADRALEEAAESVNFQQIVNPAKLGTAAGRAELLALLNRAEEAANLRLQIDARNVEQVRNAVEAAAIAPETRREFLARFDAQTRQTLESGVRLREMELRAVTAGRRMVGFMDGNDANFDFTDGAVKFRTESGQVQFTHYLSQTGQILRQEASLRSAADTARLQQRQLLQSLSNSAN